MDFLEEFKKGIEEIAHSNDLEKENKELKQKLAEKEDLLKTYTQLNEDLTKRLDDRCNICIERHKQSQNETAISVLEKVQKYIVEDAKPTIGYPYLKNSVMILNFVCEQIKSLKGEK